MSVAHILENSAIPPSVLTTRLMT